MTERGNLFFSRNFSIIVRHMARHIAIVEDEAVIRDNYAEALRRHGFRVGAYANRIEAMRGFETQLPELVIIDVSLEDEPEGGFDLCRELRARSAQLPLIFLTARDSELDAISGLRLGADDYLTKDISIAHLITRVVALLRRVDALSRLDKESATKVIHRGDLTLDQERMTARWCDEIVPLTVTEFWLVHALARYPGHVKSRQQLMDAANLVLDENTITSHIKRVRKKFLAVDPQFNAIKTAYSMGYRWQAE